MFPYFNFSKLLPILHKPVLKHSSLGRNCGPIWNYVEGTLWNFHNFGDLPYDIVIYPQFSGNPAPRKLVPPQLLQVLSDFAAAENSAAERTWEEALKLRHLLSLAAKPDFMPPPCFQQATRGWGWHGMARGDGE